MTTITEYELNQLETLAGQRHITQSVAFQLAIATPDLLDAIRAQRTALIAWQFQAAGAALALQRLMTAAQTMRDEQRYWGNLIGTSTDMLITPAINQAACILGNAEDAFDDLLSGMIKDMGVRHGR